MEPIVERLVNLVGADILLWSGRDTFHIDDVRDGKLYFTISTDRELSVSIEKIETVYVFWREVVGARNINDAVHSLLKELGIIETRDEAYIAAIVRRLMDDELAV